MLSVVLASLFGACSKDNPFDNDASSATGGLLTAALDVSLNSEFGPRSVKNRKVRAAVPDINDFKVAFYQKGAEDPTVTYDYDKMPEIVTLPVGDYMAVAFYGENPVAGWDSPYYEGKSKEFTIEEDQITDKVDPIVCKIANVRVSVEFTDELRKVLGSNCEVEVVVGDAGSLTFSLADVEAGRSGYFRYINDSQTLAATFRGDVDGAYTEETKTSDKVAPGYYYAITFSLHDAGEEDPGFIQPGDDSFIKVDATVTTEDIEWNGESGESVIEDDMRPQENPSKPDDPVGPEQPGDEGNGPKITAKEPYKFGQVNDIIVEDGESKYDVVLNIHSDAPGGIEEFVVTIKSNILTPDVLRDVSLSDVIDLVNPGDMEDALRNDLHFPVGSQVKGQQDVTFDITTFMPILIAVSSGQEGTHQFVLRVKDANGVTEKTLILHNN